MLQRVIGCLLIIVLGKAALAQGITNKGKEFWVAYGHHQYMETDNSQEMTIYLSTGDEPAIVKVSIDSLSAGFNPGVWYRTYSIPANTVISIHNPAASGGSIVAGHPNTSPGYMPKAGSYDARLYSIFDSQLAERIHRKKGIHIESNVPIVAYAHIFASVSSGATMLLPVESWGYSYTTLNSAQTEAGGPAFSWMYVLANHDSTMVTITPSATSRLGKAPNVPFTVMLMKGQVYQLLGQANDQGIGVQLTGTTIKSIPNAAGNCFPIAVFAGSSRTQGETAVCGSSGRDNDMQQCFPEQTWGKRYLTAPFSSSGSSTFTPSQLQKSVYKVAVKDPATVVKLNGTPLAGLINGKYYQYSSSTADLLEADKPIMVAQFMSGGGGCNPGGAGDPEMVFLSPLEQGIKKVGFYRNNLESIYFNYVTLIIPTNGISSLKIDGVPWGSINPAVKHSYVHPNMPGYTVVVKGWNATQAQVTAQSDSAFTGITYGLGGAESYAFNVGCYLNNLNGVSDIHNVPDTTSGRSHNFNCKGTPVKLSMLLRYIPTKLVWEISSLGSAITPNADVTINAPLWVDTPYVNGVKYYKYTLPGEYMFNDTGSFTIPVNATSPAIDNCNNTEPLKFTISVKPKPQAGFSFVHNGCIKDTVIFTGPAATANGYTISRWNWGFAPGDSAFVKDPRKIFTGTGTYDVSLNVITTDGCTSDSVKPVTIYPVPSATFGITPPVICQGGSTVFSDTSSYAGTAPIINWFWDFGNGNTANVGNNSNQTVTYPTPNTYTIKHVVRISDLCVSDTAVKVLTVNAKAQVASLTYPTSCLPPSGVASFTTGSTAQGGTAITGYSWNFGDPSSASNTSNQQNPTHTFSTQGVVYTVTLTITTATGCTGDTSFQVNANVTPVLTTNTPGPVCEGTPVTLTASGANAYSWTGPNLSAASGASVTANPTSSVTYTVTGTSNGCSVSANIPVTVNPVPAKPAVVTPVSYCQNETPSALSATATAGNSLTWYDNPAFTGGSSTAPTPSTATAGTFKYYVTQTTGAGCVSAADTITVTVYPVIANNTITASQTICAGGAASVIAGANATGGNGTYVYQWQQSTDGGTSWTNISGANAPDYNPGSPTATIRFRRLVQSALCNSVSNQVTITVEPGMTNFNISADQIICAGVTPALLDGQTPAGGSGTYNYTWESSADNISWNTLSGVTTEDYQPASLTTTTYFRRKVSGGNCVATSNAVMITVNPLANGNITAPASICQYDAADITFHATSGTAPYSISYTITDPSGSSSTENSTGVANGAIFNVIAAGSAAGNYTVQLNSISDNNGCLRTTALNTVSITVTATPVVTIAPVSAICEGNTATLTASGATSYTWSGGTNLSSTTGATVTVNPPSTQTYNVTGTTNGCNANTSVTVTVNPKPASSPTVTTPVAYCQFATASPLNATAASGHTLMWYDNAALTGGSATAITPATSSAGTFTYYVTQLNSYNCESAPSNIVVNITAGVGGNSIGSDQTLCQGGAAAALTSSSTLTGGNGTYTYQWQQSVDNISWTNIPGATNASYTPGSLNDTTYFRRNVTSVQCGSSSNVVVINVFEPFTTYNISGTYPAICEGTTPALLDGQTSGGTGPFVFTWQQSADGTNWTDIASSNTEDYQPPVLNATTHFRRKVTNGTCTATSNAIIITVNALANGNISAPAAICEYDAASITYHATAGSGPVTIEYAVTDPSGYTTNSSLSVNNGATINVIPTGSAAGVYTVALLSIENSAGCIRNTGLNNVTITVNATPVVTINPVAAICIGQSQQITATGAATYAWTGTGLNSSTGTTVTATPAASDTFTYTVIGTLNGCISAPASADLVVHPKPTASFTIADAEICVNETASFTNNSTISSGSITDLYWDFDNGMLDTTGYTFSPMSQSYTSHRVYNVKLKAVSDQGCVSDQFIAPLSVNPLPVASFILPQYVCMPDGVAQFQNTSTIANGAALSYSWNFGDIGSTSNTSALKDGSHVYPDSAAYDITLIATSAQGCTHQVTETFNTFFNRPVAMFAVSPDTLCQGIQNAFFDSSFAPGSTIEKRVWEFGDGTTDTSGHPTKTYLNPGNYQVTLEVSNLQGCSAETSQNVLVYLQPVIDAGQSFIVPQGTTITLNGNTNSGTLSLVWTSPTGGVVSDPTILRPTYVADKDGVFVLTATGEGNCTASDSITVKVLHPITIPNAFSPNGDGINDVWTIPNLSDYPNAVVEVFNRYGQPVFRSFGYTKSWDGTFNGKELPVGTYYYIIDPKSGFPRMTGYVVIVK